MKRVIVKPTNKEETPENGDVCLLVIHGIFLKKTSKGVLDELSFLPVHRGLDGIQMKLSSLNEVGAMWQKFDHIEPDEDMKDVVIGRV